jgi:UDP-N-acetyl-2-amino-2-deoxyglucuronate dehydrogenase
VSIGWGIIGCGWAAGDMCRAIATLEDARIVTVFDRVDERAAELGRTYGARRGESLEGVIADDAVDVAYIALPHHLLAPTAEQALRAGKHVLVEKPMGLDPQTIRSLEALSAERGRVAAPVFELRALPVFAEARRLVRGGAIGAVRAVRVRTLIDKPASYWQAGSWRARRAEAGGGVVLMNAIHQLDLIRYITGLEFVAAAAEVDTLYASVEVEDSAAAVFRLSGGAIGSLVAAAHSPGASGGERIEIDGAFGRIDLPDPHGEEASRLRLFQDGRWHDVEAVGEDPYVTYLNGFLAAVGDGAAPPATPSDAAAAVAVVEAVYRAGAEGRRIPV